MKYYLQTKIHNIKLTEFSRDNSLYRNAGSITIRFNRKGSVSLTGKAVKLLGYSAGDKISIYQDDENPADWYIAKSASGFILRVSSKLSDNLFFQSVHTARSILDCLEIDEESFAFQLGSEPVNNNGMQLWPIITQEAGGDDEKEEQQ